MGILHIDAITEGMILAADIHDRSGRLLLNEGAALTQRHIRMLMTWGVSEADIAGIDSKEGDSALSDEIDPEKLRYAEEELRPIFRNVNLSHPAMAELFRLCLKRKAQNETI
ncbi:MAG TPA: hypothetical protein VMM54_04570 [Nitrospirota bacterium]|nr:hypothetical protein [Nitrospirota bacterium]